MKKNDNKTLDSRSEELKNDTQTWLDIKLAKLDEKIVQLEKNPKIQIPSVNENVGQFKSLDDKI